MDKLFNGEIKERYLSERFENEDSQSTVRHLFQKSELIEDILEKDLYNFNLTEIGKVVQNMNPFSNSVAKQYSRTISRYISWAISTGLRDNNINPLKGAGTKWAEQFVDRTKKIHYSETELDELLKQMINAQDKLYLRLMFEGVSQEEIRRLKIADVNWDNSQITVYEEDQDRVVRLSEKCMGYLEKAINEKTYYIYNRETGERKEKELLESEYIIKNVKSARSQEGTQILPSVIYRRLTDLKLEMDLQFLTPNAIRQSGMICEATKIINEEGSFGDYKQYAKIGDKFKFSKITTDKHTYYNTNLMYEFVNPHNLKELYNIDIKF